MQHTRPYELNRHHIHAQTLTPVHVGNGAFAYPHEYVVLNEQNGATLYRFPPVTLYHAMSESDRTAFRKVLEPHTAVQSDVHAHEVRVWIARHVADNEAYAEVVRQSARYRARVDQETWEAYREGIEGTKKENRLQIREIIRSHDRVYVPGSSLKGVLRTALTVRGLEGKPNERDLARADEDPFKRLLVTDSSWIPDECVRVARMYRSHVSFDFLEYLAPGTAFTFDIATKNHLEASRTHNITFHVPDIMRKQRHFMEEKLVQYHDETVRYQAALERLRGEYVDEVDRMDARKRNGGGYWNQTDERLLERSSQRLTSIIKLQTYAQTHAVELDSIRRTHASLSERESIICLGFGGGYLMKTLLQEQGVVAQHPSLERCKLVPDRDIALPRTYVHVSGGIPSEDTGKPFGFVKCTLLPSE